jgi:hypothetical protein
MSTDTIYAEQPHLWAIAIIYKIHIHIYSTREYPIIVPIGSEYKHTIYLQYELKSQHYARRTHPTGTYNDTPDGPATAHH